MPPTPTPALATLLPTSRRSTILALTLAAPAVATALALSAPLRHEPHVRTSSYISPSATAARATLLTIGKPYGRRIPAGFLGLSLEFSSIEAYAGNDPTALNPAFEQLIRNITPGQMPVLRIGGDTSDWSWVPVPHMKRPLGVRINLDRTWLEVMSGLSRAVDARLILGVNLEANNRRLTRYEARTFLERIGKWSIAALELGNEPELYGSLTWFVLHHRRYYGRPHGYGIADYLHDVRQMLRVLPADPLAGPAVGSPKWIGYTPRFLPVAAPRLSIVTVHHYPLQQCFKPPSSVWYPTIAHLFAPRSSRGLADSVAPTVAAAHRHRLLMRVDEMNSMSCGQGNSAASEFASALWSVDALFEMARVGVDGVNFFSTPRAPAQLFVFDHPGSRAAASVQPVYYGLMMFAQAAPPGSRLLQISGSSPGLRAWATRTRDGTVRIALINENGAGTQALSLRIPGQHATGSAQPTAGPAPRLHASHHAWRPDLRLGNAHRKAARAPDDHPHRAPQRQI